MPTAVIVVTVDTNRYRRLGVETEIAVVLKDALLPSPSGAPVDFEAACTAVGSVHAAVELVDDRYEDFENRRPDYPVWIADDFFHCGSVLGAPMRETRSERHREVDYRAGYATGNLVGDLDMLRGTLKVDGKEIGNGTGADIIDGHPIEALVWLANSDWARANGGLPRNWVVSLGSVVKTFWVDGGGGGDLKKGRGDTTEIRVEFSFGDEGDGDDGSGACGVLDLILKHGPEAIK